MDLRLTSTPLTRDEKLAVVSVADVKAQGRITHGDEDAYIQTLIETAYDFTCEWLNGACLLNQTWEYLPGARLGDMVELPRRPFREIVSFEYLGADGATYGPVGTNLYRTALVGGLQGIIARSSFSPWPYVDRKLPGAFRVSFTAGFGTTAESIPSPLRHAIKLLAATWFDNRGSLGEMPDRTAYGFKALAGRWRYSPDHS